MVSIKDVAKRADVAISTVSKVLNNYPNVSEKTKEKVLQAIEELQYVPNAVAAALSSKQSNRIALLINLNTSTQAIDEINMQYLSGAINQARLLNLDVVTVFFSMLQDKSVEEMISYFYSQSIQGIIIFGLSKKNKTLQKLIDKEIFKIVLVDAPIVNKVTSCVWIDQAKAQYEVALKTMEMDTVSYKKLLYISGKENGYVTDERVKGIKKFAEDYHLKLSIKKGEFSELKARNITLEFAKNADMIACASDLMAIGAMRALMDMDIFRPVCGFDGITLMGYAGKQMNTVKQNFFHIAEASVEEMNQLLMGQAGKEIVLEHSLVRLEYEDIIR